MTSRWLSTVGFSAEVRAWALSAAAALVQHHPETLNKGRTFFCRLIMIVFAMADIYI